ncbi:Pr6Pr family membrane protein [Roseisalinus antarcticus]|uniref:FAR-17a/AIG1-like protein n=1 Tax=Roseisalinus antarcticus TaxID=254357 RepID=A0A1Y5SP83_9RHOB|nr:Pr6Pr family membrane protein [Roseisalinus antarcticus]SLN45243.1 hypothetical protein ROA7023_01865 [Roseisalinus antarcticus]
MHMTRPHQAATGLTGALALWAVATRVWLKMTGADLTFLWAVWDLMLYFTILTNAAIAAVFVWLAVRGRAGSARLHAGLVVPIVITGAVYHLLLADTNDYTGLDLVVDHMLHSVVPVLTVLHWAVFAPKGDLGFADMLIWVGYPTVYVVYALTRASFDGIYPYHFLNAAEQGWPVTLGWIGGIGAGFLIIGGLLVAAARIRPLA